MQLTEHFSLFEMTRSAAALRRGIDNTPPADVVVALRALCANVLQPLRDSIREPIRVNSGYRCPELNRLIGGSKKSQHMLGEAADIEVWGMSNAELARLILELRLPFDQLILEFHEPRKGPNSGWVHVSHKSAHQRRQVLTATKQNGSVAYLPGLR